MAAQPFIQMKEFEVLLSILPLSLSSYGSGDNLASAWDRTLSLRQLRLYSPKALHWDSAFSVGMFYAYKPIRGKLVFPIDTFF
jgi:hypothetical protein